MKVLIDMNLTPRWVGLLQAASIDAVHWTQVPSWPHLKGSAPVSFSFGLMT